MSIEVKLGARTAIGSVTLAVQNLEREVAFYRDVMGMTVRREAATSAELGTEARTLLHLIRPDDVVAKPPRTTGLNHFALLFPSRHELADAFARLLAQGWKLDGAADHLVSEALYLTDPEGNGIELYRDREPESWTWIGDEVQMVNDPVDLAQLRSEGTSTRPIAPGTVVGHVHLFVPDAAAASRFYVGQIGFSETLHFHGLIFASSGRYHHHVALNPTGGTALPPPNSAGLREVEYLVESADAARLVDVSHDPYGIALRWTQLPD